MLVVFSGLPGVGKTEIARELARAIGAVHLRIDSIEQALRRAGYRVEGEGYDVAYAVAEDNLRAGQTVIADCSFGAERAGGPGHPCVHRRTRQRPPHRPHGAG